jgi:ribosomal protein S21
MRFWKEWALSLEVSIREGESQDSLLRRFQRMVQVSGVLREAKAHRRFLSKRNEARIKAKNNARRRRKQRQATDWSSR